jgi:hypothetical protein
MDNEPDREYASRGEFVLRNPIGKSIVLIAATLVTLPNGDAQQTPPVPQSAASPALPSPAHRNLTAEQQRGLRLLKTAEAQASGLPAAITR